MSNHPGIFIVLEGSDGSGKSTQFKLLAARLDAAGYTVETFDFPRYDQPSSHFVRKYLAGEYGPADSINPYTASMFYALDRYEASIEIKRALSEGKIVLSNRFVGSNMAHQGSKFANEGEQRGFFMWEDSLEFQLLGIPRPDLNIFLHLPAEVSQQLIIARAAKQGVELDEHEKDLGHLKRSVMAYELLCRLFPKDYTMIECAKDGKLQSIPQISDKVWQTIKPYMENLPKHTSHSRVLRLDESALSRPVKSQSPAKPADKNEHRLNGVTLLTARLLMGVPGLSVKEISPSSAGPSPASRLQAGYKKQCQELADKTKLFLKLFKASLHADGGLDSKQKDHALKVVESGLIPLYYRSSYSLSGSGEAVGLAKSILEESAKQAAGGSAMLARTIVDKISPMPGGVSPSVRLRVYSPRNELELLSKLLYVQADLDEASLSIALDNSSYDDKSEWLKEIITADGKRLGASLEELVSYNLEIVSSGLEMENLLSVLNPKNVRIQAVSPLSGYSVPVVIEDHGLAEEYSECFDKSLELFSAIQADGRHEAAQYACLRSHNVRFSIEIGPKALSQLVNLSKSDFFLKKETLEAIGGVHPLLFSLLIKPAENDNPTVVAASKRSRKNPSRQKRSGRRNKKT